MSTADRWTIIVLCALATMTLLLVIRLPAALIIAALCWIAAWKLGVL